MKPSMKPSVLFALTSCTALALVACGDDDETDTTATTTTSSSGSGTGGSASSSSTSGTGGTGQGGTGGMGQGGAGGMGQGGGMGQMVNGCTRATASDYTGMGTVDISTESNWDFGHQACIVVDVGTTVQWSGNLNLHPPAGGPSAMLDPSSPISMATKQGNTLSVTFSTAGDYPYYCMLHVGMQGVVYVE